jgi:hypothetical protein
MLPCWRLRPSVGKELNALAEFQSIPSLGINFAEELISQGYYTLEQLKGKSAVNLFDAFEKHATHGQILV